MSLVGYCDEGDHLALIYEFMPNGDLRQHLSGKPENKINDVFVTGEDPMIADAFATLIFITGSKPEVLLEKYNLQAEIY